MKPWIAAQLFLSERSPVPAARIRRAVRRARRAAGLDALLIWAGAGEEARGQAIAACRERGVEPYLWFPVLADVPGLAFEEGMLVETAGGGRGNGRSGAWPGLEGGEESFRFLCPNGGPALQAVFDRYAALLERSRVDGVMLDRIRFPSPANGFEALLTCFCPACADRFQRERGYPLDTLRSRALAFLESLRGWAPEEAARRWRRPDALWEAAGLADLAAFRARSIAAAVSRFAGYARARGLKVGLDLFSPALAGLVGQDYPALAPSADWIKPMIYCHAAGPAGLPLELASLARALLCLRPGWREAEAAALLRGAFRWQIPESLDRLLSAGLPERLLAAELEAIRRMALPAGVEVFAGIEAVRIPRFGVDITGPVLERYLAALGRDAPGLVASWNLLAVPGANLRRLGRLKG